MNVRNDCMIEVEFIVFERMNGIVLWDVCVMLLFRSLSGDIDLVLNIVDMLVNVFVEEFFEFLKGGFCSICEICIIVFGRVGVFGWGCCDFLEVVF